MKPQPNPTQKFLVDMGPPGPDSQQREMSRPRGIMSLQKNFASLTLMYI